MSSNLLRMFSLKYVISIKVTNEMISMLCIWSLWSLPACRSLARLSLPVPTRRPRLGSVPRSLRSKALLTTLPSSRTTDASLPPQGSEGGLWGESTQGHTPPHLLTGGDLGKAPRLGFLVHKNNVPAAFPSWAQQDVVLAA